MVVFFRPKTEQQSFRTYEKCTLRTCSLTVTEWWRWWYLELKARRRRFRRRRRAWRRGLVVVSGDSSLDTDDSVERERKAYLGGK